MENLDNLNFGLVSKIKTQYKVFVIRLKKAFSKWATTSNLLKLVAILTLCFAVFWIIEGPRLVVGPWLKYSDHSKYDFRGTGQIGDTIGGITAPIIGLVSAILIYLSFTAQIRANKIIQQESNFKYIIEEFEKLKKTLKRIKYKPFGNQYLATDPFKGHFAMLVFTGDVERHPDLINSNGNFLTDTLIKLEFTFTGYSIFISEVNSLNLSFEQKKIIQKKIWLYHAEHINEYFSRIVAWNFPKPTEANYESVHKQNLTKALALKSLILGVETEISPFKNSF